jgi:lipoprotein-anchoring transpeptidase ErfK/SrfK
MSRSAWADRMAKERLDLRRGILATMLLIEGVVTAFANDVGQPETIPNPDQTPLKLDTTMNQGTGALPQAFIRRPVFYRSHEPNGTIIIDTSERSLYLIKGNNTAIRYGIGVGSRVIVRH